MAINGLVKYTADILSGGLKGNSDSVLIKWYLNSQYRHLTSITKALDVKIYLPTSAIQTCLVYPHTLLANGSWSDKRNVRISETPYYTRCQDGSHAKRAVRETTGLLKTG